MQQERKSKKVQGTVNILHPCVCVLIQPFPLFIHYNFAQTELQLYQCNECWKVFKHKSSLSRHHHNEHEDETHMGSNIMCSQCEAKYVNLHLYIYYE